MSEEYADRELEAIHEQVGGWFDGFVNSPQYEPLTETQKNKAPGVVRCFAEYSFRHIGMAPEKWNPGSLTECCVEILPGKMSAELAFFQAVAPVLSAFFTFLAEKGLLSNARALAKIVAELDEEIVAASQDQRHWGPAKAFAMAAQKAGVDMCSHPGKIMIWEDDPLPAVAELWSCGAAADQLIDGDDFLSTLHFADVRRIKVRFLRKFLLAQTSLLAKSADTFSQNAPMFWDGTHRDNRNMNPRELPSDIPGIVFLQFCKNRNTTVSKSDAKNTEMDFLKEPTILQRIR